MSLTLQTDTFNAWNAPPWVTVSGATWTASDGRAYSTGAAATTAQATAAGFDPASELSFNLSGVSKEIYYEVEFVMPATLPASPNSTYLGVTGLQASTGRGGLWLRYKRNTGGATTHVELLIAGATSASDHSLYTVAVTALAAGAIGKLRLQVSLLPTFFTVRGYLAGVLLFTSTPTLALLNSVTGRSDTSMLTRPMYGGLVALTEGPTTSGGVPTFPGYFERWSIVDDSNATLVANMNAEPTLTAAPSLTPIAVSSEDDSGSGTLTVEPSWSIDAVPDYAVSRFRSDAGHVQSFALDSRPRRAWRIGWAAITTAQHTTLRALETTTSGRASVFDWTEAETGETHRVRFAAPLLTRRMSPNVWSGETTIEEVLT